MKRSRTQEYWTIHFDSEKDRIAHRELTHFKGEELDHSGRHAAREEEFAASSNPTQGRGEGEGGREETQLRRPRPPSHIDLHRKRAQVGFSPTAR